MKVFLSGCHYGDGETAMVGLSRQGMFGSQGIFTRGSRCTSSYQQESMAHRSMESSTSSIERETNGGGFDEDNVVSSGARRTFPVGHPSNIERERERAIL